MISPGKNSNLINFIINHMKFEKYLEIGVRGFSTFKEIDCKLKAWVDPSVNAEAVSLTEKGGWFGFQMTSDSFFSNFAEETEFDLIFIDGDHSFEQVRKDLENSLNHLSERGIIVMHDMDPPAEPWQGTGPIDWENGWTKHPMGECWKALVERRIEKGDVEVITVCHDTLNGPPGYFHEGPGIETGLAVVKKGSDRGLSMFKGVDLNYDLLESNRGVLLNRHTLEEFNIKIREFLEQR